MTMILHHNHLEKSAQGHLHNVMPDGSNEGGRTVQVCTVGLAKSPNAAISGE